MMARLSAFALLAVAVVATAVVLLAGDDYTLRARFVNAGQLVDGGQVQVAGRTVGRIEAIDLTGRGLADVTMKIDDGAVTPLRSDTRASIRAVGQAGVSNRFVDLAPGQAGRALESGAVLPPTQTSGIVDLDAVLNTFTPGTRRDLQDLIANSSEIFAGSGAPRYNAMIAKLEPALQQVGGFAADADADHDAIRRVIADGATAADAIASRSADLRAGVSEIATTLGAIADQRAALGDGLARAPRLLDAAGRTLTTAADAGDAMRPALRLVPPAAQPLRSFLRETTPALGAARPVVRELRRQLPGLTTSLDQMRTFAPVTRRALTTTGRVMRDSRPIIRGLRIYGTDLILGIFNGLAGLATGNYDSTGQYVRLEFTQNPQTVFSGNAAGLFSQQALVPGLFSTRYDQFRRCPGSGAPPAPDGSSPYIPDPTLCNADEGIPAEVNEP